MVESEPSFNISAPQIVVIADGETPTGQANARGHLFERFVARLFQAYGCEAPTSSTVNVRQNGYEVDIATRFTLTREPAIAECKAYTSPLPIGSLSLFYGKLGTERLDHPEMHGWFVAIPGLTADGQQLARKLELKDRRFRAVTATEIYNLVLEKGCCSPILAEDGAIVSDHAILLTETGVCALAKQIDASSRLPRRVLFLRSNGTLGGAELGLLAGTDYASGLPIHDIASSLVVSKEVTLAEPPTLVTVVGSREDFEYQFPAAPKFFVGRENVLAQVRRFSDETASHGRTIVLNAQSGWGKSSLALRLADQIKTAGGHAVVFDTRTAASPTYVASALQKAVAEAASSGKLSLLADASFASVQSALRTVQGATWHVEAPLLIFFDQFENVFRDQRLTQEFRDLALAVRELAANIILGFSWKTDLVALTENYPYDLRDQIRGASLVIHVEPFGPKDVGTLLGRLAKAAGASLSLDLRQRLREYSQGLPWLLKKLASHILKQLQAGTSEETLLSESLNIDGLFEQDLAALQVTEVQAIKVIAREAPVPVTEIVERVSPSIIQSLVDQRLVVRVGERIDIYWDTFREFLLTGKVAVEDTYILRLRPASTATLLQYLVTRGGEATSTEAAREMLMSLHVVFNSARELRQLGILVPKSGSLLLSEQFRTGVPTEDQLRERVARALRRHTVFWKAQELLNASAIQEVSLDALAADLPSLFPAMEATSRTWRTYAVAFGSWLDYSGLMQLRGQVICVHTAQSKVSLLAGKERGRRARTFPNGRPEPALAYLKARVLGQEFLLGESARQKALSDLQMLGVLDSQEEMATTEVAESLLDVSRRHMTLRALLCKVPGGERALEIIEEQPDVRPGQVGGVLRDAFGLPWMDATTTTAGAKFRAWASHAGVKIRKVPRKTVSRIPVSD